MDGCADCRRVFCRILVFSAAPVTAVYVSVDGEGVGKAEHVVGPLYVLRWDPKVYSTGLHAITVKAEVSESCSVSGCVAEIWVWVKYISSRVYSEPLVPICLLTVSELCNSS